MISRNAVKESFDTLPAGVGCFDRNGLPRLVNHKMQQLAAVLCGRDMQTLAELQQALRSPGGGVRLLDAEAGFYEFPDRRVYRFTARPCTDKYGVPYTEVMAVDATRPAALHEALKQENERLADANRRAKRLCDNMPDIVREEEILKMKMRVHDDIGHTMLAARRALRHEQPLEQIRAEAVGWERAIALLCRARQDDSAEDAIAHTCTSYDTAKAAFAAGATHMTHLYNAMPGITHREPGPIIAALEEGAEVELITDNVHIHPAMVRFTFNTFGDDHVILIADSMMACGLPDGQYSLGGQAVTVRGPRATLTEQPGTIAGSATCLFDCMKRAVLEMGVPLESAVRAATLNPARSIGIDADYGSLDAGRIGNVVLVDDKLDILKVIRHGEVLC